MSWSQADAELLLSSAKDNQVLCWNLGSSEVGWPFFGHAGVEDDIGGSPSFGSVFWAALPMSGFP